MTAPVAIFLHIFSALLVIKVLQHGFHPYSNVLLQVHQCNRIVYAGGRLALPESEWFSLTIFSWDLGEILSEIALKR